MQTILHSRVVVHRDCFLISDLMVQISYAFGLGIHLQNLMTNPQDARTADVVGVYGGDALHESQ
jgi:hypothetical protein